MPDSFTGRDFSGIMDYWPGNQYPVGAKDWEGQEGAMKRFVPLPTVSDLRKIALIGLKRLSPEGYAEITDEYLEHHLTSTITELEMKYNMIMSPTEFFEPFDFVEGMFQSNQMGLHLKNWPTTAVLELSFKFSHAQTANPLMKYEIPPQWVSLMSSGHVNVLADFGTIAITSRSVEGGGFFGAVLGFMHASYRPSVIECRYRAGFDNDKVPAVVADWILTLASIRVLSEIGPILFPFSSTSVTIDGVNQSTGLPGPAFLLQRIQLLQKKEVQQRSSVRSAFGRTMNISFIGS